jgi:hypothetical protein
MEDLNVWTLEKSGVRSRDWSKPACHRTGTWPNNAIDWLMVIIYIRCRPSIDMFPTTNVRLGTFYVLKMLFGEIPAFLLIQNFCNVTEWEDVTISYHWTRITIKKNPSRLSQHSGQAYLWPIMHSMTLHIVGAEPIWGALSCVQHRLEKSRGHSPDWTLQAAFPVCGRQMAPGDCVTKITEAFQLF